MNLASFLGVSAQIAGDAIIKAHTDGDEEIGFLNGVIDPRLAVHTHHAEIQGIVGRKTANAQQRHGDGQVAGVDELVEYAHGARHHDAVTGKDQWTLGVVEKLYRALKLSWLVIDALALGRKLRRGCFPVEIAGGLLGVFGDIDEDWAWPAGIGDHESFANGARNIFRARDDDVVFGDRHRDAGDVDFLEGVGAKQFAADLAGNADHR